MARPRATKRVAATATDAAPDGKKSKQHGFVMTLTVPAPENVSPVPLILRPDQVTKREVRKAKAAATRVERYDYSDFAKFATPFAAAVASASAKKGRPVTLAVVITEMTNMTDCEPKFREKRLKEKWCWDGYAQDRWQISRPIPGKGLVLYPKGSWTWAHSPYPIYFSPSPAARRPLAKLSCEPSSRPSAGCVVC